MARPGREPDYRSPSGSEYWYDGNGVTRYSDHWGSEVASCDWYLDGVDACSFDDRGGWRYGCAAWSGFRLKDYEITVYDATGTLDFDVLGDPIRRGVSPYVCRSCPAMRWASYRIVPGMLADGMVRVGGLGTGFDGRCAMSVTVGAE